MTDKRVPRHALCARGVEEIIVQRNDPGCGGEQSSGCNLRAVDERGEVVNAADDPECRAQPDNCASSRDEDDGSTTTFVDEDCDGVPDSHCETTRANESGSFHGEDDDCDGRPERCVDATFTATGGWDELREDDDCDGAPDRCTTYGYDAELRVHVVHSDTGCDGSSEHCELYHYDASGNPVVEGFDGDCDLSRERSCTLERWSTDRRTKSSARDEDCDGVADSHCIETKLTADREVLRASLDEQCNSKNCEVIVVNPETQETISYIDERCDGTARIGCNVSSGNATETHYHFDEDCDGTPDASCEDTELDADRRTIYTQSDAQCDGHPRDCTTFTYDASGAPSSTTDQDCDGTADHDCRIDHIDADGREVVSHDDECDGIPDHDCAIVTTQRNPDGTRTIHHATEAHCDGVQTACSVEVLSRTGAQVSYRADIDCDGVDDAYCIRGYVVPCSAP